MYGKEVRIASVSDLHVDFADNRNAVVKLATHIHRLQADLVIIAGDDSHLNHHIERALEAFGLAAPQVAYLPGNHDLWTPVKDISQHREIDTWQRYYQELKELTHSQKAHYLPEKPLQIGSVAIAGTCGWYDYSLLAPHLRAEMGAEALRSKRFGNAIWQDARFTRFKGADGEPMEDDQVCRKMELELLAQLEDLDANPEISEIVLVTHHLPFYELLTRTGELRKDFYHAFMGSTGLGDVIRSSKKVKSAIYGHIHRPHQTTISGIEVKARPLGYPRDRNGMSVEEMVKNSIAWIEIGES